MTFFIDIALPFVLAREGGFSDDPVDRGGATNFGVTQNEYDQYRRGHGVGASSVRYITQPEVVDIYRTEYWIKTHCPVMPDVIAMLCFDAAVQHGPHKAIQLLQRALGITDDGEYGNTTANAITEEIGAGRVEDLIHDCLAAREDYYGAIITAHPEQRRFHDGWENRLQALRELIARRGDE